MLWRNRPSLMLYLIIACSAVSQGAHLEEASLQNTPDKLDLEVFPAPSESHQAWFREGHQVAEQLKSQQTATKARNLILFVGDGMGIATVTAARIFAGQLRGESGEENLLSFELFPHTALAKTYSVNAQTPDSAATMTALITGVKTNNYVLSVDQEISPEQCQETDQHKLETLLEQAEMRGLSTGIVTTTKLTHATPAATYAHVVSRSWEVDSQMPVAAREAGCRDIARQLMEFAYGDGIDVMLGGGAAAFYPATYQSPFGTSGSRLDERNLVTEWSGKSKNRQLVTDSQGLRELDYPGTGQVLGIFSDSHMAFEHARTSTEPSITEMTTAAIRILQKNPAGYFLMVEGGRVDHGHHGGLARMALEETVAFSDAIEAAVKLASDDTLIVVTADHSHSFVLSGYARRGNNILGKVIQTNGEFARDLNDLPYTTLGYGNGPGFRATGQERVNLTGVNTAAAGYRQEAIVPLATETHSGEDVPVYARGPGAQWFHGVVEQHVIYHVMAAALFAADDATGKH